MKFSLIIGTLNRLDSIKYCLDSIRKQTYCNYEVIIIDQSNDNKTQAFVSQIEDKRIIYRHVMFKGLSKARNEAIRIATGDYICLMDDDAYYDMYYLENARKCCSENTILSGYIFDTIKNGDFVRYKNKTDIHKMTLREIMRTCPSAGLIIPIKLIKECGYFDEMFGVGSQYGAGEETDILLRGLKNGYVIQYMPDMKLKHPVPVKNSCTSNYTNIEKSVQYYEGFGALYKKHMCIGKMKCLRKYYIEIWVKFFIKRFLFIKYDIHDTNKIIKGFKRGFTNYTPN